MEQAGTHGEHQPMALLKQNYDDPLVCIDAEHFLDLLAELHKLRESLTES
jgi:hypothetical protein